MLKPRIKEHFDVISESGGFYQIRNSEFVSVLKGATVRDLFSRLLPLLDGTRTMSEIILQLDNVAEPDVIYAVVGKLAASKIIEDAAEDDNYDLSAEEISRYRNQLVFFDISLDTGNALDYQTTLKKSSVSVIGSGELASSLARQAARIGIGRIFSANITDGHDIQQANPSVSFSSGGHDIHDWAQTEAAIRAEQPNVLVLALDQPEPSLIEPVNALAIDLGIGLLHCQTNGTEGIVGPFVIPGQTSCLVCHHLRVTRNLDFHREYRAWERWTKGEESKRGTSALLAPFTDAIAGMAAVELLKHASGFYEAETYGKFLTVRALTFEVVSHQVLRLPRCPGCGNARGRNSYSPWREL